MILDGGKGGGGSEREVFKISSESLELSSSRTVRHTKLQHSSSYCAELYKIKSRPCTDPFTVACSVTWPLNGSEAVCFDKDLSFLCVKQVVLMLTSVYLHGKRKGERSVFR